MKTKRLQNQICALVDCDSDGGRQFLACVLECFLCGGKVFFVDGDGKDFLERNDTCGCSDIFTESASHTT